MKLFYLLLLASIGAHAAERYATGDSLLTTMDAYARAAKLQPLKPAGSDALRIWTRSYTGGDIEGYAFSEGSAIRCRATSHSADGAVLIERARCSRWHPNADVLDALDGLVALDGRQWDCPIEDGSETYVEGMRNGRRFALRVGNPRACNDADSSAVVNLLGKLGR